MSNLLKSKFLLGVMIVAVMLVGVVAYGASSASADCSITMTLRVGSHGAEVMCVQSIVGATADGSFGPMTKAAVMAWQSSHGLVADGVVGPMTRASLMAGGSMGGFPAGCLSSSGFSTTTGLPCSSGSSSVPGCTPGALFSSTTGASCSGGSSSSGPLVGGAGSLDDVQEVSSLSDEEVAEGASDAKVAGWTLTADNGSDLAITAFKLSLTQTDTDGSDQLDDYADSVTIWQGSTKVGSADVDAFSENDNVFSKTINLSGAVIKADKDSDFFVSVDALSNIDSGDLGNTENHWVLNLESVRFQDATGAILTDSSTGDIGDDIVFTFESVAAATGTELKVSATTGSSGDAVNDGHVVDIDDVSDTNDVPLLAFDLKATGEVKNIQDLVVKVVSAGTGNVIDIASSFSLWMDGSQIDTVGVGDIRDAVAAGGGSVCDTNDDTCYVHFDDVDFDMGDGDTSHFLAKADIRDGSATLVNGDTLTADITSAERDVFEAEDSNGDDLSTELTGTAAADDIAFYDTGIMVDFVSSSATVSHVGDPNTGGDSDQGTYVIKFKVTAFGGDMFIDKDAVEEDDGTIAVTEVAYTFVDGNSDGDDMAAGVGTLTSSGDAVGTNSFRVGEGESETFTLTVVGAASTDTFAYLKLNGVGWNDADNTTAGDTAYEFNLQDFKTADIFLNDN